MTDGQRIAVARLREILHHDEHSFQKPDLVDALDALDDAQRERDDALRRAEAAERVASDMATDLAAGEGRYETGRADGRAECEAALAGHLRDVRAQATRSRAEGHDFRADVEDDAADAIERALPMLHCPPTNLPAALVARVVALEAALAAFLEEGPSRTMLDNLGYSDDYRLVGRQTEHRLGTYRRARALLRRDT